MKLSVFLIILQNLLQRSRQNLQQRLQPGRNSMSIIKISYYPLEQYLTVLPGKEPGQKNNLQTVPLPETGLNSGVLAGTNSAPSRQAFEKIKGRGILPRKIQAAEKRHTISSTGFLQQTFILRTFGNFRNIEDVILLLYPFCRKIFFHSYMKGILHSDSMGSG